MPRSYGKTKDFEQSKFLEFRTSFRPLGFWPSAIASTTTTNVAGSEQMRDCTSVHAAVIPPQFSIFSSQNKNPSSETQGPTFVLITIYLEPV